MREHRDKLARGIKSFIENPITRLVEGVLLLFIGLSDAYRSFWQDVTHGHVRVGHGLIIIGLFSILRALPHFIEGLDAGARYLELREKKSRTRKKVDNQ